jgi:tRNA threonylcarbamoyladenosine biosynthesis protein TsaB
MTIGRASARLLPLVHELLAEAGLAMQSLDGIAFGCGPGAFTGLRTSCAVAQGLAWGLDRPALPLPSLLIVAEDARLQVAPAGPVEIAVAMDARIDQVYAARYRYAEGPGGGVWHEAQAPALLDVAALAGAWRDAPPPIVAGSAWAAYGERLALPPCRRVPAEADRAAAALRLALQRWSPAHTVPAAQALPLYLRDKVALTTAERDAARAAKAAAGAPG